LPTCRLDNLPTRQVARVAVMTCPPPVVALAELAKVLGVSRVRAMQLIKRAEFPAPIAVLSVGRIWAYDAVVEYCESTGRKVHPLGEA